MSDGKRLSRYDVAAKGTGKVGLRRRLRRAQRGLWRNAVEAERADLEEPQIFPPTKA